MTERKSERKLIEAVSQVIQKEGFGKIGINKIAREAGCDKVLIYRYFGGLEGLLSAWAIENDFYTKAYDTFISELENAQPEEIKALTKKVFISQLHFIKENIVMQELLLWELTGHSKFRTIQNIREKNGNSLQKAFSEKLGISNKDINLYITLLITAIEFIILYTRHYPFFNGVDFTEDSTWERLETVISDYIEMLFNKYKL